MGSSLRSIVDALGAFREAQMPVAGALRLASLYSTIDDTRSMVAPFATSLAALGHRPSWDELRLLVNVGRRLEPRMLDPGGRIARAGEPAHGLWIVHQGVLVARPSGRHGGPMTVFGGLDGLARGRYLEAIYAARASVVLYMSGIDAERLRDGCPPAARALGISGDHRALCRTSTAPPSW